MNELEFLRGLANCEGKEQMSRYIQEHEQKPMTNADRIRAMSDEELAEKFHSMGCPSDESHNKCFDMSCSACWLEWLKTPYKG